MVFYSDTYRRLSVYPGTEPAAQACIVLENGTETWRAVGRGGQKVSFSLTPHTTYFLSVSGGKAGLLYLADGEEEGIHLLQCNEEETLHYRPAQGFVGPPSGLCRFQGVYHMFYPWNPFGNTEETLYLGHSTSRDLCVWKTQEPVFAPQDELLASRYCTGGIIRASVRPDKNPVVLYFTRTLQSRNKSIKQFGMQAETRNMYGFSEETSHLAPPPFAGPAFQGAEYVLAQEEAYILVGSTWKGRAALLLFADKKNGPVFLRPLCIEKMKTCWEAPGFFPLGRSFMAIGTFSGEVLWYRGRFREGHFHVRSRGTYDFGGDFTAPATFTENDRRLLVGRIRRKDGAACMSLLREILPRAGCLFTRPAAEVYALLGEPVHADGTIKVSIPAFMCKLQMESETEFAIELKLKNGESLSLFYKDGKVYYEENGVRSSTAEVECVKTVEIFGDALGIESYINGGEQVGTRGLLSPVAEIFVHTLSGGTVTAALYPLSISRDEPLSLPPGETFEF